MYWSSVIFLEINPYGTKTFSIFVKHYYKCSSKKKKKHFGTHIVAYFPHPLDT